MTFILCPKYHTKNYRYDRLITWVFHYYIYIHHEIISICIRNSCRILMFRFIWSFSRVLPYFRYCPKSFSYNHFNHAHHAKTQISLIIRSVWSVIAVRKKTEQTFWVIVIHWTYNKNSDQAWRMANLIRVIARRTCQFAGINMRHLKHVPSLVERL